MLANAHPHTGLILQAGEIAAAESSGRMLALRRAAANIRPAHIWSGAMEILDLSRREFGVTERGIYVLDDEDRVIAGPFSTEIDALKWIENTVPERKRTLPH